MLLNYHHAKVENTCFSTQMKVWDVVFVDAAGLYDL